MGGEWWVVGGKRRAASNLASDLVSDFASEFATLIVTVTLYRP